MSKNRNDLKILFLQIRNDDETKNEEKAEFVRFSKLQDDQIDVLNVFETKEFSPEIVDEYDALFVGGSSDADVLDLEKYTFIPYCNALLAYCVEENIPVLASCYGFQLAVEAFGGKIEKYEPYAEMEGSGTISLTKTGQSDELFKEMPNPFRAVSIHKESATRITDDFDILAFTETCPYHAFKIKDKPFYATQFHTEIDKHDLIARVYRYKDRYPGMTEALDEIVEATVDMDNANELVGKFIDKIVLGL